MNSPRVPGRQFMTSRPSTRNSSRETTRESSQQTQLREKTTNRNETSTISLQISSTQMQRQRKDMVKGPSTNDNVNKKDSPRSNNQLPPSLGLARETTSFGVFSNLSSHRRNISKPLVPEVNACSVATTGTQLKLLEQARKGDVASLRRLLYDNTQLSLNFVDDEGRTLLHLGVTSRSDDILELILRKKPPPLDCTNKTGDTALHLAAREGLVMAAYLLLNKGADVNRRNKQNGRTPLHEAVAKQHGHMTELLLFHGADPTIRSTDKRAVTDLTTQELSASVLEKYQENVREKRIEIKAFKLSSSVTLDLLDVTIDTQGDNVSNVNVLAMVKRIDVDASSTQIPVQQHEDIASDIITYDVFGLPENITATFTVPIYNMTLTSREELCAKTLGGESLLAENVLKKNDAWYFVFKTGLKPSDAFVVVCRQKTDFAEVSNAASVMTSSIDQRVRVITHANCFHTKGILSLEVLELSDDVEIHEEHVISSTPFYRLHCEQRLYAPLTLQLPEPADYGKLTEIVVLLRNEATWSVAADHDVLKGDVVTCSVSSLPVYAVVTKVNPGADRNDIISEIIQSFDLLQSPTYNACFLCMSKAYEKENKFEVVIECCESKLADARRKEWLQLDFEEEPKSGEPMEPFECETKQVFKVEFVENNFARKNGRFFNLTFHPKKKNCVKFEIKLKGKVIQFINGRLSVYKGNVDVENNMDGNLKPFGSMEIGLTMNKSGQKSQTGQFGDKLAVPSFERSNTRIDRPLSDRPATRNTNRQANDRAMSRQAKRPISHQNNTLTVPNDNIRQPPKIDSLEALKSSLMKAVNNVDPLSEEQRQKLLEAEESAPDEPTPAEPERQNLVEEIITPDDNNNTVFLQDRLLLSVLEDLQQEWYKILVLVDIPFSQIEDMLLMKGDINRKVTNMFLSWRDSNQSRPDIGLPQLLSALFKGGRRDIANTLQVSLRNWHSKTANKDSDFYKWTAKAYEDSNTMVPTDYPKPMSDQFLVLMSDEVTPTLEFACALNLSESRFSEVYNANYLSFDGLKTMKLLILFRDGVQIRIDALEVLIGALGDTGCDAMKRYAIMCTKAWVKRTATRKDDPFRYQVDNLMKKLNPS